MEDAAHVSMHARIDDALREPGARVPGFVAMATTGQETIYQAASGLRDLSRDTAMTLDTIFWLASMTKPAVSVAAMQLVERGKLALDAPVHEVAPALADPMVLEGFDESGTPRVRPARRPVTLRHLLTHTAGYGYDTWNEEQLRWNAQSGRSRLPSNWEEAGRAVLLFDPGTRWNYGIGTDILGLVVEAASGQRLDRYLDEHLFQPLGMTDTGFVLTPEQQSRKARVHARQPDGTLLPVDHVSGERIEFCMGGGRLCATGGDYLRFLRMLLRGGEADGKRILQPETVAEMARNHIGDAVVTTLVSVVPERSNDANLFPGMVQKWGLGFLLNTEPGPAGRSAGSLAWAGLGNTYFWLDPARDIAGVVLTQISPFADPGALELLATFERAVYATLA